MPLFLIGPALILIFSIYLNLLPTSGAGGWENIILPGISLGLFCSANIARITRASMLDVLRQDYVRTARMKGLSERAVIYKHALRNALIPLSTVFGLQIAMMLGGAIVTETVFAWPGIGRLMIEAIERRDYPMIRASLMYLASALVIINTIIDMSYGFIDPRIRQGT
jgi:ABC-type dipeptide/oligopeptide/nickel transport system permease component